MAAPLQPPRSPGQVYDGLLALLPDGFAQPHDPGAYVGARLLPAANELSLIENAAFDLLPQIDPRDAPQLLPDWLRMLGPSPMTAGITDTVLLGKLAHELLTNAGTICAGYFEAIAIAIGTTVTIEEYPAYELGTAECGGSELVVPPQHCAFRVTLPTSTTTDWICGVTECGEALGSFVPNPMEAIINAGAPLFTTPCFFYTS